MAFIAPKIIGGQTAPSPVGNLGLTKMSDALSLKRVSVKNIERDILIEGYLQSDKYPLVVEWGIGTMAGFDNIVKKAFYMGVGFAAYAQEKAGDTISEIKIQSQKLADEMIAKGEMNVEEARKFVDEMVQQAQQEVVQGQTNENKKKEPRVIEIVTEEDPETNNSGSANDVDTLKQQVASLQEELRRLQRE